MEVVNPPGPSEATEIKLQIEGMRAKLNEAKRFKAQYRANLRCTELIESQAARVLRENRKLRVALAEIALSRSGTTSVKYLAKYASKVLGGLGYEEDEIQLIAERVY